MKSSKRVTLFEDILELSILPRLHTKTLVRFKCVSRRWCDLISNDKLFILQQYRSCIAPSVLLHHGSWDIKPLTRGPRSAGIPDFYSHFKECNIMILDSCNGLVAMQCQHLMTKMLKLYVGNPVLQDWKMIPIYKEYLHVHIRLAFDPSNSDGCYELVCPCPEKGSDLLLHTGFMVLSSKTGEWKKSKSRIIAPKSWWIMEKSVFQNGKLYWGDGDYVLWFDTRRDCSGMIPSPVTAQAEFNCLNGSEHGLTYTRIDNHEIDIWSMKEQQWSKLYHIQIEEVVRGSPDTFALLCHLIHLKNKTPYDVWALPIAFDGKVVSFIIQDTGYGYDVESGETARYRGSFPWSSSWFPFKSNLIPLPCQP